MSLQAAVTILKTSAKFSRRSEGGADMQCYNKLRFVHEALFHLSAANAVLDFHTLEGLEELIGEIIAANMPEQGVKNSE